VICNRCHRNVAEKDVALHMASHKGKAPISVTPRVHSERSRGQIRVPSSSPSIDDISKEFFSALPQKSNPSYAWVKALFLQILKEMGLTITTLETIVRRGTTQAQVTFDETRNVKLEYDDNWLRTLDEEEIRAVLSHEACHIAVLPYTTYNLKMGSQSFVQWQMIFIDLYDEFLAHEEFRRRFGGSKIVEAYANVRTREFTSLDNVLRLSKLGAMDEGHALFLILNDAIFFPILGRPEFLQWCKANGLNNTYSFLNLLIEDFNYVESLRLSRVETMDRVVLAAGLWTGVDARSLLKEDKIVFLPSAQKAEDLVREKDPPLTESWLQRRLARSAS